MHHKMHPFRSNITCTEKQKLYQMFKSVQKKLTNADKRKYAEHMHAFITVQK